LKNFDVIIIGAGASGLMCAAIAGQRKHKVLVIDRANKVGKKILMSGGGRCNFTNLDVTADSYISSNPHFCKSALKQYTQWDFIALIEQYNIAYHERKHGELFCDDDAKDILNCLLAECEAVGVEIKTHCEITEIDHQQSYTLQSSQGQFKAKSLVVATGGLSIPTLGGSGFGYQIAKQFGLKVLPTRAGLVPLTLSGWMNDFSKKLSGIALEVKLSSQNTDFTENLLFTHRGLSGPAILQISNFWQVGNNISINLLPNIDLHDQLHSLKQQKSKLLLRNILSQYLPKNLIKQLENLWWKENSDKPLIEFSDQLLTDVCHHFKNWQIKPSGTEGYRTAEVTLGGIDTQELSSKTMASKQYPSLFFIGEVVDVTGYLGGFNFQWAWSSGYVAGKNV
jgi:predicted Rossmann fold flavoprotein